MTGQYTLGQTEQAVEQRLSGLPIDRGAMAAIGNLYRAAGVVRNHFERTVLAAHSLTWTAWVVLWVVWVWDDIETRHAASEAGISKSTLTGVVTHPRGPRPGRGDAPTPGTAGGCCCRSRRGPGASWTSSSRSSTPRDPGRRAL